MIHRDIGTNATHILLAACVAVMVIALLDAVCTYGEKWVTTTVGQWVSHDLRRALYARVQRLSLSYHDQSKTGDLISRVTDDIDAIQTFIVSGLLSIVVDVATIVGMIGVMFYLSWQLTLMAMTVVPVLFTIVYVYTRKVKKYSRAVRKQEGKMISVVQEVLGSIRVVKAFARENYEIQRLEGESLETVEAALKARQAEGAAGSAGEHRDRSGDGAGAVLRRQAGADKCCCRCRRRNDCRVSGLHQEHVQADAGHFEDHGLVLEGGCGV